MEVVSVVAFYVVTIAFML